MNTFQIVLITLIAYSLISTITFVVTKENEDVAVAFGLGIVGLLSVGVSRIIHKVKRLFKYHIGKRSIFVEKATRNKYKCKVKDANNVEWVPEYKIIKRYAVKSEWIDIPDFSKEFIENSKRNCDNCKYDKECKSYYPYDKIKCRHDMYGAVLEFDKFEKG